MAVTFVRSEEEGGLVNIRKGFMNLPVQEYQVSLVTICSDTFTHLMDVFSVGISVRSAGPSPKLSITLSGDDRPCG